MHPLLLIIYYSLRRCAGLPPQIKHCYSPDGCAVHQNVFLIAWIFLAVTECGSKLRRRVRHGRCAGDVQVLTSFCQKACLAWCSSSASFLMCVRHVCVHKPGDALHKKGVLHCISLRFLGLHQPRQEACPWGSWEVKAGPQCHWPIFSFTGGDMSALWPFGLTGGVRCLIPGRYLAYTG